MSTRLGQHTDEMIIDIVGYSWRERVELREKEVERFKTKVNFFRSKNDVCKRKYS